ncbi:MAG: metallophosphoesterase family protein [bacterium]|nr:metallophosphoesterase family protein [bacterium]
MKLGIISDIHGNIYSFEKIYKELKKEACDTHLFLGDVCGYYYHQNEIIEMLQELPDLKGILGNHDALFLEALEDDEFLTSYTACFSRSFELLKESITPESLDFLELMDTGIVLNKYAIAGYHGSPRSPLQEYIYPDSAIDFIEELPFTAVFLGHTHYPMDRTAGTVRVINPGSAGQPRDGGLPSYAVYDTVTGKAEIKRVPYDPSPLIAEIKKYNEKKSYLIDILEKSVS